MSFSIPGPEETEAYIEEALDKDTFDVLEFVKGRTNTPKIVFDVYTDADVALKIIELKKTIAETKKNSKDDLYSIDEGDPRDELEELIEQAKESALTFTFKGLAPKALDAFHKEFRAKNGDLLKDDEDAYNEKFNNTLVAKSIASVTGPDGEESTTKWTAPAVSALVSELYVSEGAKLYAGATQANYVGAVFDAAVSADF